MSKGQLTLDWLRDQRERNYAAAEKRAVTRPVTKRVTGVTPAVTVTRPVTPVVTEGVTGVTKRDMQKEIDWLREEVRRLEGLLGAAGRPQVMSAAERMKRMRERRRG